MPVVKQILRVEKWRGAEKVDPNFHFTVEDFDFDGDGMDEIRKRPTRAEGAVWGLEGQLPRREELTPLADLRMDGTVSTRHATFSYGGHLIAHRLTGIGASENIVPVTQNTNTRMKSPESAISKKATPQMLQNLRRRKTIYRRFKAGRSLFSTTGCSFTMGVIST
jgi:hypothetical protein